jgi:hypothetical protein
MMSSYNALYPNQRQGKDVYLQGSRQMDSVTRQYYERSLGAGMFVSPMTENGLVGYSEPFRRFVQHDGFTPQVNEIQNDMPSWIPGEDHLINFQKGDPYVKLDEGYARLPGAGYAIRLGPSGRPTQKPTSRARRRPSPLPSPLVPSPYPGTASQTALHSRLQRFSDWLSVPCLLLARMQVISFRRGWLEGSKMSRK